MQKNTLNFAPVFQLFEINFVKNHWSKTSGVVVFDVTNSTALNHLLKIGGICLIKKRNVLLIKSFNQKQNKKIQNRRNDNQKKYVQKEKEINKNENHKTCD
ncbi:MAG: hypothetical protein ABH986_04635 [archaeon]